jgi:TPP-dependent 2-oxoacid decarboxylase
MNDVALKKRTAALVVATFPAATGAATVLADETRAMILGDGAEDAIAQELGIAQE